MPPLKTRIGGEPAGGGEALRGKGRCPFQSQTHRTLGQWSQLSLQLEPQETRASAAGPGQLSVAAGLLPAEQHAAGERLAAPAARSAA
jgi:hypothetical protein